MTASSDLAAPTPEPGEVCEPLAGRLPVGKSARSLAEQVAERLLEDIFAGRHTAGDRLKEIALAQEHAVSRATVREALIALEKRGFVERIPRVGARVTALEEKDIEALYEARATVLAAAAALCAERASEALGARLQALANEMVALAEKGGPDPRPHAERAVLAQRLIANGCGNRYLAAFHEQLLSMGTSRLVRGRSLAFAPPARRAESARDWQAVAWAIAAGDGAAAAAATRMLMGHSVQAVRAQLAGERSSREP